MKTLAEILVAVKSGERPVYEELRYALCVMDALLIFAGRALSILSEAELQNTPKILSRSAVWQFNENSRRVSIACSKPPKQYLGWHNDPDNPQVISRRKVAMGVFNTSREKLLGGEQ